MKKSKIYIVFAFIVMQAFFICSCAAIQKKIDLAGMEDIAEDIQRDFDPGSKERLEDLINNFSLEEQTRPFFSDNINIEALDRWKIDDPLGKKLIMEKISFPSLIKHKDNNDTAIFYLYRHGDLKDRDVILWVPGMAVSDLAFLFIKQFFYEELERNYDIAFYVPPFHMERKEHGKDNGEGFFTADTEKNMQHILNAIRELRTISDYLKKKGVRHIGGWGGSIGAAMLLLTAQMVDLDHLCIMIPIINWETVFLGNEYMREIVERIKDSGYSEDLLFKAYGLINPVSYGLNINPMRIHIMYAEFDQLTPPDVITKYAIDHHISKITSYKRSHATILLTRKLYKDCGIFLDSLQ